MKALDGRKPQYQLSLHLIQHKVNDSLVEQRSVDGYINATELCKAAGKQFEDYVKTPSTREFLARLAEEEGRPVVAKDPSTESRQALIETSVAPSATRREIWVHPNVAINLGQWLSPAFAVKVSKWVTMWMSGLGTPKHRSALPYHIRRHMENVHAVPAGYFSVLQEMTFLLIAPLDTEGYELPERLVPDISMGRFLCDHLRKKLGIDPDTLPVYSHKYPGRRPVAAKLYPEELLPVFRKLIRDEWMPKRAAQYFRERDPAALPYLDRILHLPAPTAHAKIAPPVRRKTRVKKKAA